jgi:hypothetical protein
VLSSYPVVCPYEGCGWRGNLVPSLVKGGDDAEVLLMQRAWLRCPSCRRDWEVRVSGDAAEAIPAPPRGEGPAARKGTVPMAQVPERQACPKCGHVSSTLGVKTLQIDMRPVLTAEVFAFPDALAEVSCLKCKGCGHWICLDYRIELDDNPELDLNPE